MNNKKLLLTVFILLFLLAMPDYSLAAKLNDHTKTETALTRLKTYIPKLTYKRGDRWPLLIWHRPLTDKSMMKAWTDRGIASLCTGSSYYRVSKSGNSIKYLLPYLEYQKKHHQPIILEATGWVQSTFYIRSGLSNHVPPAKQASGWEHNGNKFVRFYGCPSMLYESPRLPLQTQRTHNTAIALKKHGIVPTAIMIDFESGPVMGSHTSHKDMEKLLEQARLCSRCVNLFGMGRLQTTAQYLQIIHQARAYAVLNGYSKPLRNIFPDIYTGNFGSWPTYRVAPIKENWTPYHGYAGSGSNLLQPYLYYYPGQGNTSADAPQQDINWTIFHGCLSRFSRVAQIKEPGEKLVPWVGYLFNSKLAKNRAKNGGKVVSASAYKEMAIQMMMRGAETFAVFEGNLTLATDFPSAYPKAFDRRDMGPFLLNLDGIQQGYNEMLRFNQFLRKGKPMTYKVPEGYKSNLWGRGAKRAVWSGVATAKKALVRTVSFGKEQSRPIHAFNKIFTLPFKHQGKFFWLYPNGKMTAIN